MGEKDGSSYRNRMIDLHGWPFGCDRALAREIWREVIQDADALRRETVPDSYHNDMVDIKGKLSTRHGPQLKRRAAESVDEFLHCEDNAKDRELWAMLGFGLDADELVRRVEG